MFNFTLFSSKKLHKDNRKEAILQIFIAKKKKKLHFAKRSLQNQRFFITFICVCQKIVVTLHPKCEKDFCSYFPHYLSYTHMRAGCRITNWLTV